MLIDCTTELLGSYNVREQTVMTVHAMSGISYPVPGRTKASLSTGIASACQIALKQPCGSRITEVSVPNAAVRIQISSDTCIPVAIRGKVSTERFLCVWLNSQWRERSRGTGLCSGQYLDASKQKYINSRNIKDIRSDLKQRCAEQYIKSK